MRRKRLARVTRPWWGPLLLRRGLPFTYDSGGGRGTPVDRRYIEAFLHAHRNDISGVCLEVESSAYTRRYGGRVTRSDVLDIEAANPNATIIGDLRRLPVADNTYDCAIITQTLHLIDEPLRAVDELRRVVRPGGVVLATFPFAVKLWGPDAAADFWRFTPAAVNWLFTGWDVQVSGAGNALTGAWFYLGLAQEDLPARAWRWDDVAFPVVVAARASRL